MKVSHSSFFLYTGFIIICLGVIISLCLSFYIYHLERASKLHEFNTDAQRHAMQLERGIFSSFSVIDSISSFYSASDHVSRSEFKKFVTHFISDNKIHALEWVPRVKASERMEYEEQARLDGLSSFMFTERLAQGGLGSARQRDEYYPVLYVEPIKGNESALGYDLGSSRLRMDALIAARDTGSEIITRRITLVQEAGTQYGVLVAHPIYSGGDVPVQLEEKRELNTGFAIAVLRVGDIITSVQSIHQTAFPSETFVFDVTERTNQELLFPSNSPYQSRDSLDNLNCFDHLIDVAGRSWIITVCPSEQRTLSINTTVLMTFISSLVFTGIFYLYFNMRTKQRLVDSTYLREIETSESRYRDVVDNTQILIQSSDTETGKIILVNKGWLTSFGYTTDETTSLNIMDMIHPDSLEHCKQAITTALKSGVTQSVTTRFVTKGGANLDVDGCIMVRRDLNNVLTTHGVFSDVTELNKSRIEQERIVDDLTRLIDTANAPIFGIDVDGQVTEWNLSAERITGFKKVEVLGKDLIKNYISDDYKLSVKNVFDKALHGEQTANFDFPLFAKNGDRIDILLNSTTRRDASGTIVGVVGVGQNITERKIAEAQVIHASKLATLGEMATAVAHELNQPLNVIRMAAGNCQRRIDKGTLDNDYLSGKLQRIESQTERAASIIDHMRMFGRKTPEDHEAINACDIIDATLELIGEQLRLAEIEIVKNYNTPAVTIRAHRIQFEQVILNLLTNSKDAMFATKSGKRILIRTEVDDESNFVIMIEDNGPGIPSKVIDRIFEPFFTTKAMGKGTGLGLSVSYGIIREMDGTIFVENTENGALFTIKIPLVNNS